MPAGDPNSTAEAVMLQALKGCAVVALIVILAVGAVIGAIVS